MHLQGRDDGSDLEEGSKEEERCGTVRIKSIGDATKSVTTSYMHLRGRDDGSDLEEGSKEEERCGTVRIKSIGDATKSLTVIPGLQNKES
ncbi:hypothetical protein ACF0H5_018153 [Mactra antiquata]